MQNAELQEGGPVFRSSLGLIVSCLGCVVGTGNIWRFSRIVANNSGGQGALQFFFIWLLFMFLWSIPVIIVEYAVGRFTRKSPLLSFRELLGVRFLWCGGWIVSTEIFIGSYYSVVLGWCFYFLFRSIFYSLPINKAESVEQWNNLVDSHWPVFTQFLCVLFSGIAVVKAASSIELVNMVLVPLLLVIVVFSFYWSIFLKYASEGIMFLFTPDWDQMISPKLWVDAAVQNLWDTGAGTGLFLTYATFMTRHNSIVKLGTTLPAFNNLVSLLCCITTFSTIFSVERHNGFNSTEIINILKENGPANTGLTFIWMPLLYNSVGSMGRTLCCLFFLCLSFAGLSSLVSIIELLVHTLEDIGETRRKFTIPLVCIVLFLFGLPSSLNIHILVNQDFVWGLSLIISGLMTATIAVIYGTKRFRRDLVNMFGTNDWQLPLLWEYIIKYIVPVEAVAILIIIMYDIIKNEKMWYEMDAQSFMTCITEWLVVLVVVILVNVIWIKWRRSQHTFFRVERSYGSTT